MLICRFPFELCKDASHLRIGAAPERPDGAISSSASCTFAKEALAVVMVLRYFRSYLEGRHLKLFTDNQAPSHLLSLAQPKGWLVRWIAKVQQFAFDIAHWLGKKLPDADGCQGGLQVKDQHENIKDLTLWEAIEDMELQNRKLHLPKSDMPNILRLYHDSPKSGGHGRFWKTYWKISSMFTWDTEGRR